MKRPGRFPLFLSAAISACSNYISPAFSQNLSDQQEELPIMVSSTDRVYTPGTCVATDVNMKFGYEETVTNTIDTKNNIVKVVKTATGTMTDTKLPFDTIAEVVIANGGMRLWGAVPMEDMQEYHEVAPQMVENCGETIEQEKKRGFLSELLTLHSASYIFNSYCKQEEWIGYSLPGGTYKSSSYENRIVDGVAHITIGESDGTTTFDVRRKGIVVPTNGGNPDSIKITPNLEAKILTEVEKCKQLLIEKEAPREPEYKSLMDEIARVSHHYRT